MLSLNERNRKSIMKTLTKQDLMNLLYGCAILGTGGGGSLDEGIEMIEEALSKGKTFQLVTFDELDPEDMIGSPYACGAISPQTEEIKKKYSRLKVSDESFHLLNMRQLEQFLGKKIKAVLSTELGGGNTATALYVAAMNGIPILDGDPAGRSVPALQHSTYYLNGVPMCPMSVMNMFGEGAVFTNVYDDERGEDLVRALAVESMNTIAVVDHVNTAQVLKDAVIRGAISFAIEVGKAYQEAKDKNEDYVEAVLQAGKGKHMFAGTVTESSYETTDGYTIGNTEIKGTGDYEGHTLKIWYQNENIISWLDNKYYVTVPDLICVFDLDNAMPQLNPLTRVGEQVKVIALPAPMEWRTKRGLEVFGPKSFGHEVEYVPFCG